MSDTPKTHILVAEDDATVAMITAFSLERAGYSVDIAPNGQDAMNKANVKRFDMVITDEQMPLMSGQELCRHLRHDKRYAETPIIFVTGKRLEMQTARIEDELQVAAIMGKPFSPQALVDTVHSIIA